MKTLKVGVIGTGHMGTNHVRNLANDGRFELVGVYDENCQQALKVADKYNTVSYSDMDKLLEKVEAVVVAVPSSLHKDVGLCVAGHNVHALIEKPIATSLEDATLLTEAFNSRNLKLAIGHIERFNPVIRELDKIIVSEQVFFLEAHRYSPYSGSGRITDVSVIEDLMIHDIELICHLMEPFSITDIRGNGEVIKSNATDFATCMLDFGKSAHAIINASRVSQNKEREITIHTKDSIIRADLLAQTLTITKNTDLTVDVNDSNTYKQVGVVQHILVPREEPLRAELISFYNSIVYNEPVAVTGEIGTRALEICQEVIKRVDMIK